MRYKILTGGGLLLIAAALCSTIYNLLEEHRAAEAAQRALQEIVSQIPVPQAAASETAAPEAPPPIEAEPEPLVPGYILDPEMEMPTNEIDGAEYIGVLEIPALGLSLPVISTCSNSNLKLAPCRYSGSAYLDNMIIAAHNYKRHFGELKNLCIGDEVFFTDMDGNCFTYVVSETEQLDGAAIEEMEAGEWDLTLFTCTIGGKARVTVRCEKTDKAK